MSDAVKLLRGEQSRQVFATECGLSMTAVQNYETGRTPDPKALLAFMRRAIANGSNAVADVFRTELRRALGADPDKKLVI